MDSAGLAIRQELTDYRNRSTLITYRLKDKVEHALYEPYPVNPVTALVTPRKEEIQAATALPERRDRHSIYLDFPVGGSVINPGYKSNFEELARLGNTFRDVINRPGARIL
jgi:hypothetical protein